MKTLLTKWLSLEFPFCLEIEYFYSIILNRVLNLNILRLKFSTILLSKAAIQGTEKMNKEIFIRTYGWPHLQVAYSGVGSYWKDERVCLLKRVNVNYVTAILLCLCVSLLTHFGFAQDDNSFVSIESPLIGK